jgi:HD-GYP domain-containing protein (c-di-GMP phosphodiesterase class II)
MDAVPRGELIACLALATDLGMGHPWEQGLGACIVATRLGELAGLDRNQLAMTHAVSLLRHIGCTTENEGLAEMVGDEIAFSASVNTISGASTGQYVRAFARSALSGVPVASKPAALARLAKGMRGFGPAGRAICEVAQMLAGRLGFEPAAVEAVGTVYERWDGHGMPNRLQGEAIPLPVRISQIADLAVALHDTGHPDPASVVGERAGGGFDPDLAELFRTNAGALFEALEVPSRWDVVRSLDPAPAEDLAGPALDEALHAVADFADLKSPYLVGHSSGVAALAEAAAGRMGLPISDVADVRRGALLHDLGRVAVSVTTWGKRGTLNAGEWEAVRLHPYHTDRLFARSASLGRVASMACLHHERMNGSGYVRGCGAAQLSGAARVLAAADVYHAMTEPRPHRAALAPDRAAAEIRGEVRAGRLDAEAVEAVLAASGHRVARRREYAAGLTAREVEVLRLLARGGSIRQIATDLVVAPKTVDHHIQSIYAKAGVSTRAAATVFAMQHGLLDPLDP